MHLWRFGTCLLRKITRLIISRNAQALTPHLIGMNAQAEPVHHSYRFLLLDADVTALQAGVVLRDINFWQTFLNF